MDSGIITLKGQADRRIKAGHVWVYSNEVDNKKTPLRQFSPGQEVAVHAANGKPLGRGFVNPNALICVRLFSSRASDPFSVNLLKKRFSDALSLREMHFDKPFYRFVFGDSDGLPGLVADRFDDILVVQISNAGMERFRAEICEALVAILHPKTILLKNDGKMREVEKLESYVECLLGEMPETIMVEENGVRFEIDPVAGQKTGWFYDHRMNRLKLKHYVAGKRVLDLFSYAGGWGVQAACFGADQVVAVDASQKALAAFENSASLNGMRDKCQARSGDVFEVLKALSAEGEKFDVVICDPPALIPRRKDMKNGEQAYARLNQMALRVLSNRGILVSASCSMHLSAEKHMDIIRSSGRHVDRFLQVIDRGGQAPDHPVLPGVPETEYLKAIFVRSSWGW
ncbi:MAG: RlmI/RlmK family 23S rRNA methyltransferase [Proteobacteria bacterium]|nr:MAG: RlmI/RlmK family 23S rRNA methyltransferase [Pseudomonadota bacterium]